MDGRLPGPSNSDIRAIAQGATTLAGNWCLDSGIDLRRRGASTVRVRKRALAAADRLSISFTRLGKSFWVSVHDPRNQSCFANGLPFDSLAAAFVYLGARIAAIAPEMDTEGSADLQSLSAGIDD
jgi:hypothetical protein